VAEASEPQLGVATATIESSQSGVKKLPTLDDTWVVQLLAQRTEAQTQAEFRRMQTKYSALGSYQLLIRKKDQGKRGVFYAQVPKRASPYRHWPDDRRRDMLATVERPAPEKVHDVVGAPAGRIWAGAGRSCGGRGFRACPVSSAARRCCTRGRLVQPPGRFAGSTPPLLTPMLTLHELRGHSSPTDYSKKQLV
jgi:hypothetical protein